MHKSEQHSALGGARRESREICTEKIAWRAAASGGALHPGAILDISDCGARLVVRMTETPALGAVIKALRRGERYPIHYRVLRVSRSHPGSAELGCRRINGCEYRAARSTALQRLKIVHATRVRLQV